jgi:hypothetical protein
MSKIMRSRQPTYCCLTRDVPGMPRHTLICPEAPRLSELSLANHGAKAAHQASPDPAATVPPRARDRLSYAALRSAIGAHSGSSAERATPRDSPRRGKAM